jgi:hypothetical protein
MMKRITNLYVCDAIIARRLMMALGVGGEESFELGRMTGVVVVLACPRN